MNHPDDPVVIYAGPNTCYCPDTPEQRAKFERMCARLEARRNNPARTMAHKSGSKRQPKPLKPDMKARAEAYKQAFRQPQGAYDRGIVARY